MRYYSTNHHSPTVSIKEALTRSEAPDGGLYMPESIPLLPKALINNMSEMSLSDISYVITNAFFNGDISSQKLKQISDNTLWFPLPVYETEPGIYVMELFHGPTMTVKDIGARFMAALLLQLKSTDKYPLTVLVPTTGNSGNAIANVLHDVPDVNVYVLYPRGLPHSQIDRINAYGGNIHAIEVMGHIDDCINMVTRAMHDAELNETMRLTTANSLNIANVLPYIIAYFDGVKSVKNLNPKCKDIYYSIPTGSAGNVLAACMARRMGLPISGIFAACSDNTGFATFMDKGMECVRYGGGASVLPGIEMPRTPNIPRLLELDSIDNLRREIKAISCTENEMAETVNDVFEQTGYLLDPHSATAYKAVKDNLPKGAIGIVMATSHPLKSYDILKRVNRGHLKLLPDFVGKNFCRRAETRIPPTYSALKRYLKYESSQQEQYRS